MSYEKPDEDTLSIPELAAVFHEQAQREAQEALRQGQPHPLDTLDQLQPPPGATDRRLKSPQKNSPMLNTDTH